ncbi:hypothetical protein MVEN_01142300 [Mycena venus]|uniref:Uncharacterized protein n=1 Tax=Mycena venus TaxID=2733690 RepID=A0A8H6Y364_9AGAR|nr:hypothetical protein MVEN_01142300 [Mycena venus]
MNNEKALMLTTKGCLIVFFNKLYGNDTPGALRDCIDSPRLLPCSNCLPRFIGPLYLPNPSSHPRLAPFVMPVPTTTPASTPPAPRKLTKKMRNAAEAQLSTFRDSVYSLERDNDVH